MNWLNAYRIVPVALALVVGVSLGTAVKSFAGKEVESSAFKGRIAKTVFLDISVFGRKDRAANRMTKMHQEYAREGWTLQEVTIYTENGDLEGFFITYVKEK
jgi:hypothetical protein